MNQLYDVARVRALGSPGIQWAERSWRVALLDDRYVFDATHRTVKDLDASVIAWALYPLKHCTVSPAGVALTRPQTFGIVPHTGRLAAALVIAEDDDAGELLWYGDQGFGLPFYPNSTEYVASPDLSTGGFFRL